MLKQVTVVLFFSLFVSNPVLSAATESPMDNTRQLVDAMLKVKKGDEESYKMIDNYFNYDIITSNTIAPHKDKFSGIQSKKLKTDLTQLIRIVAYPQSGTFYKESKYTYNQPKVSGNKAIVIQKTYLPKEDLELDIGYQWENNNGKWRITDITFDDDSIVKDYQNQFGRIISKNGVDGLLQKLDEKLKEMENN
ncbi:MAG: ABC transporter substrate-binding protein [Gammaproteobacteria bacterium]|nr:ABC transporter substrate-binding protein [Gammaproteobacteria bacterium]